MTKWVSEPIVGLSDIRVLTDSGEIIEERPVYKKREINYNFTMVFDLRELAKRLSGKSLEAFTIIVDKAGYGNTVDISSGLRKMLMVELNTSLQNISKYLKEIREKDLVRHIQYDEWMINPELVWKGNLADREAALLGWGRLIKNREGKA